VQVQDNAGYQVAPRSTRASAGLIRAIGSLVIGALSVASLMLFLVMPGVAPLLGLLCPVMMAVSMGQASIRTPPERARRWQAVGGIVLGSGSILVAIIVLLFG